MKHLIMKQVIALQIDAGQNAFLIQQQAREYSYGHILRVMERLFDELSSENEVLSIDKLEIDLGDLGWKNNHFTIDDSTIYNRLKESLKKTISTTAKTSLSSSNIKYRTPEEAACLQWLYYMENGVLPWEIRITDNKWHEKILYQLAIDHELIQQTKKLIIGSFWFLSRLVREHDEIFLQQLVEVITAKRQEELIARIKHAVNERAESIKRTPDPVKHIWHGVLKHVAGGEADIDLEKILLTGEKSIGGQLAIDQKTIPEGLYCQYAGLVLLHPFFKILFSRSGLTNEGLFINNTSRQKAIMLLYFVATGKTELEDHELIVPKILCGMPLYEVIDDVIVLNETDRDEALNMMHAAIDQWTILHNTSPEGLRESFLMREGKLIVKDMGIEFRIESSAIDVLLDHLPWNLSLIKLSWLNELIRVEWR